MKRMVLTFLLFAGISLVGAPIDFKFDPNVRRPTEKPVIITDPFLIENGKREGVETLPSGVQIQRIEEGYGKFPEMSDEVEIDYVGWLPDGTVFDSSIRRGQHATFPMSGVVPGFAEGLSHVRMGGKARIWIPSHLGYGKKGSGDVIPPDTTLVFEVTIYEIK
ncbi:MAG: FKBP-type peptidyl-prolyl cis-trans isomerase [Verrucomicrobiae bacterium]|nr:FKBP-type peptidyl-prolyl cis-trans isomerase [Verrucomicrobiae bacterium]